MMDSLLKSSLPTTSGAILKGGTHGISQPPSLNVWHDHRFRNEDMTRNKEKLNKIAVDSPELGPPETPKKAQHQKK
eukprot:6467136-Amphidinium_carterae.1